ncbi:MAG: TIGR03936 family radical SAM-associated protein [Clostridiaceae bacterium]
MKVRYLIKFTKESEIKFVGHLDLMRTIQRMMKRSGLPIVYSQGFNPHINLSLAQPLAVGVYSGGDYFDVPLLEEVDEQEIKKALNSSAPSGIRILEAAKIKEDDNKKIFKSMAAVDAASYSIRIRYKEVSRIHMEMETLLDKNQWVTLKKSKSGEKEVDIKPMVRELDFRITGNILIVEATVNCGSKENLSPELLAEFVKTNTSNYDAEAFTDIRRNEMYAAIESKLIPLYKYVKTI